MKYSDIPSAQLLVLSCKAVGIKDIVICPGSRNAPLTLSFTEDSFFKCYSIVDERSAAFFALGLAQHQNRPTAVVCTSGSALLNYYPAVAEAFYSDVPLVVISADRPPYKIDVGDGQTIRQDNVFDRHIGFSANLKLDTAHAFERIEAYSKEYLKTSQEAINATNLGLIQSAFEVAFYKKLPVHINIPFEEPLYGLSEVHEKALVSIEGETTVDRRDYIRELAQTWSKASRKMIIVGVHRPNAIEKWLLEVLANDPRTVVFTETTSNLYHPNFFSSIDSILFPIEKSKDPHERFTQLQPEVLLTFGGLVVSKKIKAFLRRYRPMHHWHVHHTKAYDTYFSLSEHVKMDSNEFLRCLLSEFQPKVGDYYSTWDAVRKKYEAKRTPYLKTVPFSDFMVFDIVQKSIPKGYQVHLSNSSTVRYTQLFEMDSSLKVFCNRGTSGIDGTTSTAIGSSIFHDNPTILVTGDLSFFYDSNALWNDHVRNDFRIIVINNFGGGIFRILPGFDSSERFATFFETTHERNAEGICTQFGLKYESARNAKQLEKSLDGFFEDSEKPRLLEVFTPRETNDKILLGYFDFISSEYQ